MTLLLATHSSLCSDTSRQPRKKSGFTLVELMVSITILVFLLLLIASVTHAIMGAWKSTSDRENSFVAAQTALETIKRNVAQATLNTYWSYLDAAGAGPTENGNFVPATYGRLSELFFLAGPAVSSDPGKGLLGAGFGPGSALFFEIPDGYTEDSGIKGLSSALNVMGYFVKFENDEASMPQFVKDNAAQQRRYRFRLYEVKEPTENMMVYADMASASFLNWAQNTTGTLPGTPGAQARPIAENVILLLARCVYPDAAGNKTYSYVYNSRTGGVPQPPTQHQLPARIELTLVALDESSAARLAAQNGSTPPVLVSDDLFTDPTKYDQDMADLEKSLGSQKLKFRSFRDEIAILSANWSSSQ